MGLMAPIACDFKAYAAVSTMMLVFAMKICREDDIQGKSGSG